MQIKNTVIYFLVDSTVIELNVDDLNYLLIKNSKISLHHSFQKQSFCPFCKKDIEKNGPCKSNFSKYQFILEEIKDDPQFRLMFLLGDRKEE